MEVIKLILIWPDCFIDFNFRKNNKMKPTIIRLDLAGTTVHINANNILYYYAKHTEDNRVVTELFFTEKFGLEVSETPAEIDALIGGDGKVADLINV